MLGKTELVGCKGKLKNLSPPLPDGGGSATLLISWGYKCNLKFCFNSPLSDLSAPSDLSFFYLHSLPPTGRVRESHYFINPSCFKTLSITCGKCSISKTCSLSAISSGVSVGVIGVRNCAMISPPSQTLLTQ